MLYRVRLQYGFLIDATNRDEAYSTALHRLRENPETAISGIQSDAMQRNTRPLWTRLLFGH